MTTYPQPLGRATRTRLNSSLDYTPIVHRGEDPRVLGGILNCHTPYYHTTLLYYHTNIPLYYTKHHIYSIRTPIVCLGEASCVDICRRGHTAIGRLGERLQEKKNLACGMGHNRFAPRYFFLIPCATTHKGSSGCWKAEVGVRRHQSLYYYSNILHYYTTCSSAAPSSDAASSRARLESSFESSLASSGS